LLTSANARAGYRKRSSAKETPAWIDNGAASHRQYKHQQKSGVVALAGKPGDDLAPGTLNSVFKQAGLKKKE
jgi:hypothetical protein